MGVTTLSNWLPVLAVYDNCGWQPVPFIPWHQPWFNEAGIYGVRITLPCDQQIGCTAQVAAVTKQEDAEALVNALRRKNYPVFLMASSGTDKLFHVQVGPFSEPKDAETMRAKLAGDGYNAIVKK